MSSFYNFFLFLEIKTLLLFLLFFFSFSSSNHASILPYNPPSPSPSSSPSSPSPSPSLVSDGNDTAIVSIEYMFVRALMNDKQHHQEEEDEDDDDDDDGDLDLDDHHSNATAASPSQPSPSPSKTFDPLPPMSPLTHIAISNAPGVAPQPSQTVWRAYERRTNEMKSINASIQQQQQQQQQGYGYGQIQSNHGDVIVKQRFTEQKQKHPPISLDLQTTIEQQQQNQEQRQQVKQIEDNKHTRNELMNSFGLIGGNGENITQLSMMVYKIARKERINSLVAIPCESVSSWMPDVTIRLQVWNPDIEFFCIDTTESFSSSDHSTINYEQQKQQQQQHASGKLTPSISPVTDMVRMAFAKVPSTTFIRTNIHDLDEHMPRGVDLVVSWMGVQTWGIRKTWKFMKHLRRSGARLCLISNNAVNKNKLGVEDGGEGGRRINVRKSPILFNEPARVIRRVSKEDNTLQLLLYDLRNVREDF